MSASKRTPRLWVCEPVCGSPLLRGACVWCRGNVARAWLARLKLGTRLRYVGAATPIGGTGRAGHLAGYLLMFQKGRFPTIEVARAIRDDIQGYCLDAPELMPGGSVVWAAVPEAALPGEDPDDSGYPEQRGVLRDVSQSETGPVSLDSLLA